MTTIDSDTLLADIVIEQPHLAPVLDRLGLDYCCGGQREIGTAAIEAGLDPDETVALLSSVPGTRPAVDWSGIGLTGLVDHIEETHHAYLREVLPHLRSLAAKVHEVHGNGHPELAIVRALVDDLVADMEPHLLKEEIVLFPMVRELAEATTRPDFHCGTLANPIRVMATEHDAVGKLLAELRVRTDGYEVPADGCASYRALYEGLAELEADTHLHVHKENNILFPAVIEAERVLAGSDS